MKLAILAALLTACTYVTVDDAPDVAPIADTAVAPDDAVPAVDTLDTGTPVDARPDVIDDDAPPRPDVQVADVIDDDGCPVGEYYCTANFAISPAGCTNLTNDAYNCGGCHHICTTGCGEGRCNP